MKIFISGVAGFIGSNLAHFLIKKGLEVWGIDNLITGTEENLVGIRKNPHFSYIKGNIIGHDFSALPSFDIIFHLASPASPVQYKRYPLETLMTNAYGTKHLLDFMKDSESKTFVMASTSEVYGDPHVHPQTEDYYGNVNPVGERSVYDEGKRFAESLVMTYYRHYSLDARIARIFNTYGPNMERDDGRVVSNFICQALSGKPLTVYGKGTQTRSFCFVSDMIEALYLLGTKKGLAGQIINIGNPDERSIIDMAHLIKKVTDSPSSVEFQPIGEDDPSKRKPDIKKARELLGWQPTVALEDGLAQTKEYFKKRYF